MLLYFKNSQWWQASKSVCLFHLPVFFFYLFFSLFFFLFHAVTFFEHFSFLTFSYLLLLLIPNSRRTCTQEWEQKPVISLKLWTEQGLNKRQLRKRQLREYMSSIYINAFLITNAALRIVNGTLIQNTWFLGITAAPCVCRLFSHAKNKRHVLSIYAFVVFIVHKNDIIMQQMHQHCSYDVDI